MVRITEQLVRKKSEHNELLISTLEELSLHQEDIEKIEHLQNWCRDLKILLLQSNLISKIENLHKLKKLEYLNLALNNIERIENLEDLESLNKLDLTLNFIGELSSVKNLCGNHNLKTLILTGNPCTDFNGYRSYVITVLPQLEVLDGIEIKPSDRIKARKEYDECYKNILNKEIEYKISRDAQKIRVAEQMAQFEEEVKDCDEDERTKRFWQSKSENCPETRYEMAQYNRRSREPSESEKKDAPKSKKLFAPCGRPYNMNQPKFEFRLDDEGDRYDLHLGVYKFLDTSQIDVDVQPKYVRVTVKGKVFQLELGSEVITSTATCKRSQTTGTLLISMPKLCQDSTLSKTKENQIVANTKQKLSSKKGGVVDYRNICRKKTGTNEDEIPELI